MFDVRHVLRTNLLWCLKFYFYFQMATLLPGPKDVPRRRFVPLRRRKVLSPLSRGLLLAGVFALWFCLSFFFYGERDEEMKENYWKGRREIIREKNLSTLGLKYKFFQCPIMKIVCSDV